jgi:hypothetical protein
MNSNIFNYNNIRSPGFSNTLSQRIKYKVFMNDFKFVPSPADGHCLLYSFITSYNSQMKHCDNLDYFVILNMIRIHTIRNINTYTIATNGSSQELILLMKRYIYSKDYDSNYCDIVPIILSRILCINICIIDKNSPNGFCMIKCDRSTEVVYINKSGLHYDGLVRNEDITPSVRDSIPDDKHEDVYVIQNPILSKTKPCKLNQDINDISLSHLKRKLSSINGLNIAHINIRSLRSKIDELSYIIKQASIDILCITETWFRTYWWRCCHLY